MLTKDESSSVIDALSSWIALTGDIRQFIQANFGTHGSALLKALPLNLVSIPDLSDWLVQQCLKDKWSSTPSLLELLLVPLINQAGHGWLAPILARVRLRQDPNPNPFDSLWIRAGQPFFDRTSSRRAIQHLVEDKDKRVLRIFGPSRSGKSYSAELLAYAAQEGPGTLRLATAAIGPGNAPSYDVTEMADYLTLHMNPDPMPQRTTASYGGALARWIIRNANRHACLWVFILDGFAQRDIQPDVRECFQELARQALQPTNSCFRLLLIDFEQDLLGNWRVFTLDDRVPDPATLTSAELKQCLLAHNQRISSGQAGRPVDANEIDILADSLLTRASTLPPTQRLQTLYDALCRLSAAEAP